MGILVGTALIVIIPEGVGTLYESTTDETSSDEDDKSSRSLNARDSDSSMTDGSLRHYIGLSLIAGFVLMYLIDQVPKVLSTRKSEQQNYSPIGMSSTNLAANSSTSSNSSPIASNQTITVPHNNGFTVLLKKLGSSSTTVGLTIHALADGVAFGASLATGNSVLEFIVFIAIMIHKMPASFGLTAVLLQENLSIPTIKIHLAVFASSAPFAAILTWSILIIIGSVDADITFITGLLLIFSGGTFIYVAVHVMQEFTGPAHDNGVANDLENADSIDQTQNGLTLKELGLSVVGMLLPLVITLFKD